MLSSLSGGSKQSLCNAVRAPIRCVQVRRTEGRQGEGGRPGGLGDMSKCTSQEEIHVAAMEGVKSSQIKKLVSTL